jgi:hypothetical protein
MKSMSGGTKRRCDRALHHLLDGGRRVAGADVRQVVAHQPGEVDAARGEQPAEDQVDIGLRDGLDRDRTRIYLVSVELSTEYWVC